MDPDFELCLTEAGTEEAWAPIRAGLDAYNEAQAGYADRRHLNVLIREVATDRYVGGLLGRTSYGLMYLDLLFIPESARGQGLGRTIVQRAEREAITRGCSMAVVYTVEFQAPDFYVRLGYREMGRVVPDPPGFARIFMSKRLVA